MSAVRAKNTKPELAFRRRLFAMGFRFRLHRKDLPGTPDIIFPKYSAVVFIHGCFWHCHGCRRSELPTTRRGWWRKKLEGNWKRDRKALMELKQMGWRVLTVWECSFRGPGIKREIALDAITLRVVDFLISGKRFLAIPRSLRSSGSASRARR